MILREVVKAESDPRYTRLEVENTSRQFGFLMSLIECAKITEQEWLSQGIIKALNYHAIACLHDYAGQYRPCSVELGEGSSHEPPPYYAVPAQMDHFVHVVNKRWNSDPAQLAAFVLWRLTHIHPFINGNGRTARAAAYFVICMRSEGVVPGKRTLPELLCDNRAEYMAALKAADKSYSADEKLNLKELRTLITRLLEEQLASAG